MEKCGANGIPVECDVIQERDALKAERDGYKEALEKAPVLLAKMAGTKGSLFRRPMGMTGYDWSDKSEYDKAWEDFESFFDIARNAIKGKP